MRLFFRAGSRPARLVTAIVAVCCAQAMPTHAATVFWDPEGSDSLTQVIQSVWSQTGDHIVQLPSYDVTNGWYGNGWQPNEIMWEWAGDLNAGLQNRQCTTLTIQGGGAGMTWLGSSSATGKGSIIQNGWNRVNAVNMNGITFKDLSIVNLAGTSMFGLLNNGASVAHDITFENCHVYLGTGVLQGRTNWVGGDPGTFHFVNSTLAIANNRICVQWDYSAGRPDKDWARFDADSRIAKYTGTYSASDPAAFDINNYDPDLVNVGDLYFQNEYPNGPAGYTYGWTNTQFASFSSGEYFLTSLTGVGAAGWDGGTPWVAPVPEPGGIALAGSALVGLAGAHRLLRRRNVLHCRGGVSRGHERP